MIGPGPDLRLNDFCVLVSLAYIILIQESQLSLTDRSSAGALETCDLERP